MQRSKCGVLKQEGRVNQAKKKKEANQTPTATTIGSELDYF